MDEQLHDLHNRLSQLYKAVREETRDKFQRLNPFYEDLFDWKERGVFWTRQEKNVTIYNSTTLIGNVLLGENTWVGPFCMLDGSGGLTIGSYCSLATGCQLLTHDTVKWALSGGRAAYEHAPTAIGNCCFIGTHAVILKGVTLGDHVLVGAGAVVTKDVPANTIVGGVPARPIGRVHIGSDGEVSLSYGQHHDGASSETIQ